MRWFAHRTHLEPAAVVRRTRPRLPTTMPRGTLSGQHALRQRNWAKKVHKQLSDSASLLKCCASSRKGKPRNEGLSDSKDSSSDSKDQKTK